MKRLTSIALAAVLLGAASSCTSSVKSLAEGSELRLKGDYCEFSLSGEFLTSEGAVGEIAFHDAGAGEGYKVVLHNGPIDGSVKSGSLAHVRNLYRSLGEDGQWCPFELAVRGRNIAVRIAGVDVVCYTEPEEPYRLPQYASMRLGSGAVRLAAVKGDVQFKHLKIKRLPAGSVNPCDTLPPVDERSDRAIRLQQEDFPVIDWHVHLKGGLTAGMAHAMSMNYGINYGVAPNAGEGGVGRMLSNDSEVYAYYDEVKGMPFLCGVQGEGRRWTAQFSSEALGVFDYLFTDAMTVVDHKGRLSRLYRAEEVLPAPLSEGQYMDMIVDQTVKILSNEPADIFANAMYLPDFMAAHYDELWTDERIDRVLDVMQDKGIALEISARYLIPNEKIIRKAKQRGMKFTFGTNNADADFGRLEYSIDMARKCGLTAEDMWFPSMSTRASRPTVIYNFFADGDGRVSLFNGRDLEGWVAVVDGAAGSGAGVAGSGVVASSGAVAASGSGAVAASGSGAAGSGAGVAGSGVVASSGAVAEPVFSVKDGKICVSGHPNGYLRSERQYGDYTLYVEWRWVGEGTNSGIFQRVQEGDQVWPGAIECQLKAGRAGDLVGLGGARIAEIPFDPAVKFPVKPRNHPDTAVELPEGEWNRAEIVCHGSHMSVYINGSLENEATLPYERGYVALQSEGGPLEFRNIYISK